MAPLKAPLKTISWLLCAACLAIIVGLPELVGAAPGVTLSPSTQEIVLQPDQASQSFSLDVTNQTAAALSFDVSAVDFKSLDESGGVAFVGPASAGLAAKYGLAAWILLEKSMLAVPAGDKQSLKVTVLNQAIVAPGGHYGAIILSVKSPTGSTIAPKVSLKQNLAALLFVRKVGGEHYDLRLDSMDIRQQRWRLPDQVKLRFYNPGNIHIVPRGKVKVIDMTGRVVSQGIINEASGILLPETHREYVVKLSNQGLRHLLPGRYRIIADYRYDGFDPVAHKEINIIFGGQWLLLAIVGVILTTGTGFFILIRRHRSKRT